VGEREVLLNPHPIYFSLFRTSEDPFPPALKTFQCCRLELAPLRTAKDLMSFT
jgi:hypothetical protein